MRVKKGQRVKMGHQEIAGVLWGSVLLCCALSCSGGRFATDIPRAKWLIIKYLKLHFMLLPSHNPKVVGSNPTPATNKIKDLRKRVR
jgi:hypothetical protein